MTREDWRYGYQGAFAEDEETGYTAFELRMYDARFGRWTSTDPYGQYWSPYVGMGNMPQMGVDPDGGRTISPGLTVQALSMGTQSLIKGTVSGLAGGAFRGFALANGGGCCPGSCCPDLLALDGDIYRDPRINNPDFDELNRLEPRGPAAENVGSLQAGLGEIFDNQVLNNIATAVGLEVYATENFLATQAGKWLRNGKAISEATSKFLSRTGRVANALGTYVVYKNYKNEVYSPQNDRVGPLIGIGDAVFNGFGYTGIGTPFSFAYFLGVKPLMNCYTNQLKSNPVFLQYELRKATSSDIRFGGPK